MRSSIVIGVLCIAFVSCKEKSGNGSGASEIEMLIEQLASPNRPLNPERQPLPIPVPDGYDIEAQKKVYLAESRLASLGKRAFPLLIGSRKDERYCLTGSTSIEQDFTVGEICLQILGSQI